MASGDDELDKVVKILKSLIVPIKGGMPLHQLEREYKMNEGRPIPLAKLGFANITALVRSISEIRLSTDGILTVESANLAHLTDLVARQKSHKPKGRKMPRLQTARPYGARNGSYATRSHASAGALVRRPVNFQRSFNAPSHPRSVNAPSYPRSVNAPSAQRSYSNFLYNGRPSEPQPMPAKSSPGQSQPVSARGVKNYSTTQPRSLPTVVYPGKKSEPTSTEAANNDKQVNGYPKPVFVSRRLNPTAKSYCNVKAEQVAAEPFGSNGYPSKKLGSAAHRLVTSALGYQRKSEESGGNVIYGDRGDAPDVNAATHARVLRGRISEMTNQGHPATFRNSAELNSDSSPDVLSALFAEIQIQKAPSHNASKTYPATPPPSKSSGSVDSAEAAAMAFQSAFLARLSPQTPANAPTSVNPALAAWDPPTSAPALVSPTVPSFLGEPRLWGSSASIFHAGERPGSALSSPPAAPFSARMEPLQDAQLRSTAKPLKPMDRLLRQNLDNTESVRARYTLDLEVERERLRTLGHGPSPKAAPSPPATYTPAISAPAVSAPVVSVPAVNSASYATSYSQTQPVTPLNVICDWERQSALMMIKPLYNDAQLIGDNLMMQVAKLELSLENHFVRAEGVPYRVGLCVSGLTLSQAMIEVKQQRAVNPTLLVCLGSIDILMNCELSTICRNMLLFLGSLTLQSLLIQRVYVCNLPAIPTATPTQRETLLEFNRWLEKFCLESRIFVICDIFATFLDNEYQIDSRLYAQAVRINMGSDCIVQLQPWSKLGCRAFLDTVRHTVQNASAASRQ